MKNIIIAISDNKCQDKSNDKNSQKKLIIIETNTEKDEPEVRIRVLDSDSVNKLSRKTLDDLVSDENRIFLVETDEEDIGDLIRTNVKYLRKDMFCPCYSLTIQQRQVMDLASDENLRCKEIADRLKLSYHTVKHHISHVMEKMDVHSLADAIDEYLLYKNRFN